MSKPTTFYVIKDMRTHGYYMKTDKYGATFWAVSPFIAKKFKTKKEANEIRQTIDNCCLIVAICAEGGC